MKYYRPIKAVRDFGAESAVERDGVIHFIFPDGQQWLGKIIANRTNLFT